MDGGKVIFHFTGDSSNLEKKASSVGDIIKGSLAAKGISKGIQILNSNLDGAIKRVDILNNFPNVMGNLGIGAEDSTKAINKLSDKLNGLPTTLDSAVSAVQRFTSKNGDVGKSTDMFLAVNNAILAGGASMDIQSSALEQLSQAYSKGKPDMMEWRTLQMAMPAQLNQVAQAFNMTADDMGEALRDGSLSMDDFINKIMELNTTGVGEFASFEEQARSSTGGIQTSITNLKTGVTRGIGNMIQSINKSLEANNLPNISQIIQGVGDIINKIFKAISDSITAIAPVISKIIGWIKENKTLVSTLAVVIGSFIATFKTIKAIIAIINSVKDSFAALNATVAANHISLAIAAIAALVLGFIYLWNNCEGFRNFWIGLWNGIVDFCKTAIDTIVNFFTQTIPDFISKVVGWVKGLATKIADIFTSLPGKLVNIGKNLVKGLWNGINNAKDWVLGKIKGFGNAILKGIKGIFGIHSPSTEFAWIGKMNMLGLTKGMEDMQPEVQQAIDGMFDLSPSLYGTTSNNLSPVVNVTNINNIKQDPLGQMVNDIKTFAGGSKNDYNYGMGV